MNENRGCHCSAPGREHFPLIVGEGSNTYSAQERWRPLSLGAKGHESGGARSYKRAARGEGTASMALGMATTESQEVGNMDVICNTSSIIRGEESRRYSG